ncbi:MAG: hypothetical protein KDC38_19775, partial [Planctomycetes bacterium]|nr:hypothetical protein [Planctomycetota bacterium]
MVMLVGRATAATPGPPFPRGLDLRDLRTALRDALVQIGSSKSRPDAQRETALRIALEMTADEPRTPVAYRLSQLYYARGDLLRARSMGDIVLAERDRHPAHPRYFQLALVLAGYSLRLDDYDRALSDLEAGERLIEPLGLGMPERSQIEAQRLKTLLKAGLHRRALESADACRALFEARERAGAPASP